MPDAPLSVSQNVLARDSQQATGLPHDEPIRNDESGYSTDTDSDDEASWEAAHGACHSKSAKLFLLAFRCMPSTAIDLILKAVHLPTFQPSQIPWKTSQKLKQHKGALSTYRRTTQAVFSPMVVVQPGSKGFLQHT